MVKVVYNSPLSDYDITLLNYLHITWEDSNDQR